MPRSLVIVLAILGSAAHAQAQELAGTFDQLRVLVKAGDRIRVTDASGNDIRGTIATIAASSLTIEFDGMRRDFMEADVDTIRHRRPDSLANGARWGFAIGGGLGLLGGLALAGADGSSAAIIPVIALVYGGLGAAVGTGVDAMLSSEQVIYARRSSALLRVTPLVGGNWGQTPFSGSIGIALSLSR